ncbi:HNH endonuclease [Nocardia rhizosphaerihabitans]|uniref:HNH endonuclease n=1 Tax=Nocardia rhizosphaerihabitans TaxID=1691570 RepID=UPI00366F966C
MNASQKAWKKANPEKRRAGKARARERKRIGKQYLFHFCDICAHGFMRANTGIKFCSPECREKGNKRPRGKTAPCRYCGFQMRVYSNPTPAHRSCANKFFSEAHGTETCYSRGCRCDECREANSAAQRAFTKRYFEETGKHYRLNYLRRYKRDWIPRNDRLAIYERDNWTCQLCMMPVDPELDPRTDRMGATLDHIFPKSRGGSADWSNLQLAHRACNSTKNDKVQQAA